VDVSTHVREPSERRAALRCRRSGMGPVAQPVFKTGAVV
jgi:hypothetical protein